MRLQGKAALVTGAGGGIGWAIVRALAREGASILANDLDEYAAIESATAANGKCVAVAADIGNLACHEHLIERAVGEFGGLDILINNAGIQFREPFLEAQPESWDRTLAVNLKGPYFLAQQAAKRMVRSGNGGTILNIASIHDSVALLDRSVYAITKGGLRMMTRALALELAEYRVTVNAISPGAVLTGMNREALSDSDRLETLLQKIPLGRLGTPEDIAEAAVFLVSPEAAYITGATLYVDGGFLVQ